MFIRVATGLAMALALLVCDGQAETKRGDHAVKLQRKPLHGVRKSATIEGKVILNATNGQPVGNGKLIVTAAKQLPFVPGGGLGQPQWETVKLTTIDVKNGESGPWAFQFSFVPPNTPLHVFVRYKGAWSGTLNGGTARGGAGPVSVPLGTTKQVNVILKGVPLN